MKLILLTYGLLIACATSGNSTGDDRIMLSIRRNYEIPRTPETVTISADWRSISTALNLAPGSGVIIRDHNFGRSITPVYLVGDGGKVPSCVLFEYTFTSTEPVFGFLITPSTEPFRLTNAVAETNENLVVSYLKPYHSPKGEKQLAFARNVVESTMNLYPDLKAFPIYAPRRWNYEYAFFMYGAYRLGQQLKQDKYTEYARTWIDDFIQPEGAFRAGVYRMDEYKLDDIEPGRLALEMYQKTQSPKYKSVADTLMMHLDRQPKTSAGGYWHKEVYPHQMWLDGIFMADVFTAQCAVVFKQPRLFDEATKQVKMVYQYTLDSTTGLMRHGWDESGKSVWVDSKGRSPEAWCRAVGWYTMSLVEILDYLPANHADRPQIISILKSICASVMRYKAPNGLWYQVMDKGSQEGNWIEASGSAMFAYTFAKGHRLGFLGESYKNAAQKALQSLIDNYVFVDSNQNIHLSQTVKIGTLNTKDSDGSFRYYTSTERRIDDYKGLGALLYASIELSR